jgi:hypothetical protein
VQEPPRPLEALRLVRAGQALRGRGAQAGRPPSQGGGQVEIAHGGEGGGYPWPFPAPARCNWPLPLRSVREPASVHTSPPFGLTRPKPNT